MKAKLIVIGGGETNRVAIFADAEGLRTLEEAFRLVGEEGEVCSVEIDDLVTGSTTQWDIHLAPVS